MLNVTINTKQQYGEDCEILILYLLLFIVHVAKQKFKHIYFIIFLANIKNILYFHFLIETDHQQSWKSGANTHKLFYKTIL